MLVGGLLQHFLGVKLAIFVGSLCVSLSTILGYWTINNYYLLCGTYGLIFGVGVGIAYSSPMTAGNFTTRRTLISSYEVAAESPWSRKWFNRVWFRLRFSDLQLRPDLVHQPQERRPDPRPQRRCIRQLLPRGSRSAHAERFLDSGHLLLRDAAGRHAADLRAQREGERGTGQ